jgi:hypothetical protein
MNRNALRCLVRAWLLITVVDALFASLLSQFAYGAPFGRVWQGVASVLLGPTALQGGGRTIVIGLIMHACVALVWSTVFLLLALALPALRRAIATPTGIVATSVVYGPVVWLLMSMVLIPMRTGRPPTINARWWVNYFAHIPFVALPIVATIGRGLRAPVRASERSVVSAA